MNALNYRINIEHRIVTKCITDLVAAGYQLAIDDGDEKGKLTTDIKELTEIAFNLDDCWMFVYRGIDYGITAHGWVRFTFGNNGWDVISDYTTNLETELEAVNEFADRLSDDLL